MLTVQVRSFPWRRNTLPWEPVFQWPGLWEECVLSSPGSWMCRLTLGRECTYPHLIPAHKSSSNWPALLERSLHVLWLASFFGAEFVPWSWAFGFLIEINMVFRCCCGSFSLIFGCLESALALLPRVSGVCLLILRSRAISLSRWLTGSHSG